jgi:adenosine kinase
MSILVSGSLAYDKIMNFPGRFADHILPNKIHVLNVSFAVTDLQQNFGGTAGNIAYNLALMNEKPTIIATAGNDFNVYKKWLTKFKINLSLVKVVKSQPTACAHIITDQADNQITGFHAGAMLVSVGRIPLRLIKKSQIAIVAPGNVSDMVNFSKQYQKASLPYIFDPGQAITALTSSQLRQCLIGSKVFIVNDYELSLTLKKISWTKRQLLQRTEILVTTLGEKGSKIETRGKILKIPAALPKNTSDPTGAGDAYRAGFIKGLVSGWPLEKTGRLAATVAVYTVEKYGTQTHKFSWGSLLKRYRANFG